MPVFWIELGQRRDTKVESRGVCKLFYFQATVWRLWELRVGNLHTRKELSPEYLDVDPNEATCSIHTLLR